MIAPMLFSDINGDYRGADDKVYNSEKPRYTSFSLWDTYRAKQPLMTIIQPEKAGDFGLYTAAYVRTGRQACGDCR